MDTYTEDYRPSFEAWMKDVDKAVRRKAGVSVYDLADANFFDAYEDGVSAVDFADDILAEEGFDDGWSE